jgi:hypothetical protein
MAWTLKALAGPVWVQSSTQQHKQRRDEPALTVDLLEQWALKAGFDDVCSDELRRAVEAVRRAPRERIYPYRLGRLLRLHWRERDASMLWTAIAIDETPRQRKERKAAEKLERDRIAKAARDENDRQTGKRKSRAMQSDLKQQRAAIVARLCEQHGKGVRTIERWLQQGRAEVAELATFMGRSENGNEVVADPERSEALTESRHRVRRPFHCHSTVEPVSSASLSSVASPHGSINGKRTRLAGVRSQGRFAPGLRATEFPSRLPEAAE